MKCFPCKFNKLSIRVKLLKYKISSPLDKDNNLNSIYYININILLISSHITTILNTNSQFYAVFTNDHNLHQDTNCAPTIDGVQLKIIPLIPLMAKCIPDDESIDIDISLDKYGQWWSR